MSEYLNILLLAAMPAAGNFAGGIVAEVFNVSAKSLSLALHLAAGIILALVGVELMPQALESETPWIVILAFIAGGACFTLADKLINYVQKRFGKAAFNTSAWSIYFAVSIDLFSDGVMIGSGSTVAATLGLLLALGQVPADLPEGFATLATFKN
jgi:ZIP family zinc transporter